MSKLGIGFIGCGGIHHAHAPQLVDHEEAYIAGAMDVSEEAVRAHCEKYGTKYGTTERAELLAREDVQAVVVCTPTGFHKEAVMEAAAAGTVIVNFASGDQQITCWSWGLPGFGYGVPADSAHDVLGPRGSITFPGGNYLQVNLADGEHQVEFDPDTGNDWFRKQMAHFIECCRTGKPPVTGAREGIEATRIAAAALSVGDRPAIIEL
jgi:predicted dehydrogenase